MEIEAITRKWGNSIAVVIPSMIAEQQKIKENERVFFKIEKKKVVAKDFFGKFPRKSGRSAQEIKDEARKGWG